MKARNELFRFVVAPEEQGQSLDQVAARHISGLSGTLLRRVIDLGGVHVGGRRTRQCGAKVIAGQQVEVYLDGLPLEPFSLEERHVIFRDDYLLAINKPAGVDTQPTHARYKGCLYEALLCFLHNPFRPQRRPELGMIQRLDRNSSGILIFSTHPRAHKPLTQAISNRRLVKCYLALVAGVPSAREGEIRSLLARGRRDNLMKSVARGGREALTHFRVLHAWSHAALLQVRILTGRSHQIRVHLAEQGHPLLGDGAYGGPETVEGIAVPRHMLHSWYLELDHPISAECLKLQAPVASDMQTLMSQLGMPACAENLLLYPGNTNHVEFSAD